MAVACTSFITVVVGAVAYLGSDDRPSNLAPTTASVSPPTTLSRTTTAASAADASATTESTMVGTTDRTLPVVRLGSPSGRSTSFTRGPQVVSPDAFNGTGASVAFSLDGTTLAAVTGNTMRLYNASDLAPLAEIPCPVAGEPLTPEWTTTARSLITAISVRTQGQSCAVTFSRDGRVAASGNRVWDTRTGRSVTVPGDAASISPDGKTVVTGGSDGIQVWNAITGALVKSLDPAVTTAPDGHSRSASFNQDGRYIVELTPFGLTLWDARTLRKKVDLVGRDASSPVFAANSRRVAAATFDGISLWDSTGGAELLHVEGASGCRVAAASRDATLLATAGSEGAVVVVDAATGLHDQLIGQAYRSRCLDVAYNPDGTQLAVATRFGIQIWLITH